MSLRPKNGRIRRVNHLKSGAALPGGRKIYQLPDWKKMSDGQKVKYIKRLILSYGRDPRIRNVAVDIYRKYGVKPRDYRGQAKALLAWTQKNIYYLNEPSELLQAPTYTINPKVMSGDCDDIAILLGALATSSRLGVKVVLSGKNAATGRMVRWVEGTPQPRGVKWAHIYVMVGWPAFRPTKWEAMEGTLAGAPLGWDVTRSHLYKPIAGAPGVPLFPELAGPGGFGALSIERPPVSVAPVPSAPAPAMVPTPAVVAQMGKDSRTLDAKEKIVRRRNRVAGFVAGLDWQEIAVATLPAIISGFVLARIIRRG
jgi:hypothetical protein|tara:strand:- start:8641 stop:9576 length:936 start_codon:yes stop_codon:yes gene_type:complete